MVKRAAGIAISICVPACAGPAPPKPPPYEPPAVAAVAPVVTAAPSVPTDIDAGAAPSAAVDADAGVEPPKGPSPKVAIETPFKIDLRPIPREKEAFLTELRDRMTWNDGGLGELEKPIPESEVHPMPRVIIDVTRASGQRSAADVQRILRKNYWIRVIECYQLGAYKDQKLRGEVSIRFQISGTGKPRSGKTLAAKLPDQEVVSCLADHVTKVDFGKAKGATDVWANIHIGAGDEPMPPPAALIVPGDGQLDPESMSGPVKAVLPQIEACYRAAFDYAPRLWGRLGLRFHLTEKGKVDEVFEAESRFPDERVSRCILHVARGLKFDKPKGGDLRFVVALRLSSDRAP
jgi:hypothetical protein